MSDTDPAGNNAVAVNAEPEQDTWQGISPKHMVDEFVTLGFLFALIIGATLLPLIRPDVLPPFVAWVLFGLAILVAVANLILVPFRVRAMRYWLRGDDFVFRRGVIFQRQVAVPYGRLQLVDINRGPLSRLLGLAEIRLVTAAASSGVTIPGIVMADSEALRDELVALAESRRAGL